MRSIKILLSADWHLDSRWEALSSVQAAQMRENARRIPARLRRIAEEAEADLILLAGDLFDSNKPYTDSARELERAFRGMDIPVFISPGNHDCFGRGSAWDSITLPDNVYVFRRESLERVSTPFANIYGAAFIEPERMSPPELRPSHEEGKYDILLLHADLDGRGKYMPLSKKALSAGGFHFAALGHIHQYSSLQKAGSTWWCYPGCPIGRGFDECGEKGAVLITLSDSGCEAEFLELSDRRYERIEVCVTGRDGYDALGEAVGNCRQGDICRFELTGECENPPGQSYLDSLAQSRGLYAAFLKDKTTPPVSSDALSLKNTLIRFANERMSTEGADPEQISAALKWAIAALEGAEAPEEVAR